MNSSEIMDLLGSVGDGPYVKNVDIVIVNLGGGGNMGLWIV